MGIYVGLGILLSYTGIMGRSVIPGLYAAALTAAGLLIGRLVGLYLDGISSKVSIYSGLFELCTCIVALYGLYRLKASHLEPRGLGSVEGQR
jgi:hypothetical protein